MAEIKITINSNNWPKLQMVTQATDEFGGATMRESKQKFDLAYGHFENELHNILRPIVESVINFKKRGQ